MEEIRKKIFELLDQDKDIIDIKKELDIPIWQISKIIETPVGTLDEIESKILDLFNEGLQVFEIKDQLNVPLWKIYKVIESQDTQSNTSSSIINNADGLEFNEGGLSNEAIRELMGEEKYSEELTKKFLDIFNDEDKAEIIKNGSDISYVCCDCGFNSTIDKTRASLLIYKPSVLKYMGLLNKRVVCTVCESYRIQFLRKKDGLLVFHPDQETNCSVCNQAIILPRIKIQPDTNICNLCAANEDIPNPFPKNPLDKCPECGDGVIQVQDNDGELKIYCKNFRGKKNKNASSCNWIGDHEDYVINNIMDKEYFKIIKDFRLEISKKEDVPLFYILTNHSIEEIVSKAPTNQKELLEKCPSVPRSFIENYSSQFFLILRKLSKKKKNN